jgi:hypothetical protein
LRSRWAAALAIAAFGSTSRTKGSSGLTGQGIGQAPRAGSSV